MYSKAGLFLLQIFLVSSFARARSVHASHHEELDDADRELLRSAYDAPAYDTPGYEAHGYDSKDDYHVDVVGDVLWAIKAKLKELSAFDRALVSHLLATKQKLRELLLYHKKSYSGGYQHQQSYAVQHAPAYGPPPPPAAVSHAPAYPAPPPPPAFLQHPPPPEPLPPPPRQPQPAYDPYYGH